MTFIPKPYSSLDTCKEDARYWWLLCPFHDDHRPSMSINKSGDYPGHFRCWSCGQHGSHRRFAQLMGQPQPDYHARVTNAVKDFSRRKTRKSNLSRIDFESLNQQCQQNISDNQVQCLSQQLGVSSKSLTHLGIGYDGAAYTFPMFNIDGRVIGLRRRLKSGRKLCKRGSRLGLFIPNQLDHATHRLLVCEGEGDTAAALTLGFNAIGRPGCKNCTGLIVDWIKRYHGQSVVIVADNDEPGKHGARELANKILFVSPEIRIIAPPAPFNDIRDWLGGGATISEIVQMIDDTDPVSPKTIISQWVPHRKYKGPFKKITTTIGA